MKAHAALDVALERAPSGGTRTRVSRLRSEGPLVLRQTGERFPGDAARLGFDGPDGVSVALVAGAAGPLGGDEFRLDVHVHEGATLFLRAVAGTVVLPGPHGTLSRSDTNVTVDAGGTLVWLPGVQIAAAECHHAALNRVDVAPDGRVFLLEEVVLGRSGEQPGRFRQRLRASIGGKALYDQELAVGADMPGWRSPAVTGGRKALGSALVINPGAGIETLGATAVSADFPDTAVMQLSERAFLVSGLADDVVRLRRQLAAALDPGLGGGDATSGSRGVREAVLSG